MPDRGGQGRDRATAGSAPGPTVAGVHRNSAEKNCGPGNALLPFGPRPCPVSAESFQPRSDAFDAGAFEIAVLFAAHARVLMVRAASASRAAHLHTALRTSWQIGAAIGILMTVHQVTEEQAYTLLRCHSNHLNRKLHDLAHDVARTRALP